MGRHTSLHIGGPADYFVRVRSEKDLVGAVRVAREAELPAFILGGGTNLLVASLCLAAVIALLLLLTLAAMLWPVQRAAVKAGSK